MPLESCPQTPCLYRLDGRGGFGGLSPPPQGALSPKPLGISWARNRISKTQAHGAGQTYFVFSVVRGFVDVGFSQLMLLSCLILRDLAPWVWVSGRGRRGMMIAHPSHAQEAHAVIYEGCSLRLPASLSLGFPFRWAAQHQPLEAAGRATWAAAERRAPHEGQPAALPGAWPGCPPATSLLRGVITGRWTPSLLGKVVHGGTRLPMLTDPPGSVKDLGSLKLKLKTLYRF